MEQICTNYHNTPFKACPKIMLTYMAKNAKTYVKNILDEDFTA